MNDEKIKISLDECNRATNESSRGRESSGTVNTSRRKSFFIPLCVIAVVIVGVLFVFHGGSNPPLTIEEYQTSFISSIIGELSDPENPLRKHVENAHLMVDVSSASVRQCRVKTIDGSNRVGSNQSNLDSAELVIRFYWDGPVQKDGYTDVQLEIDLQNHKVVRQSIAETTALFNIESVEFWSMVTEIGMVVLGCL